ncbi:hypothetical protein FOZ63_000216, partial [Perkinsus olseni]
MSFEQLIIGVPAAAALLSNFPLVTAIGAIAPDNPAKQDYPPWWKVSSFDTLTNTAFCDFKNFADNYAVPGPILRSSKILSIVVEDTGIHTDVVGVIDISSIRDKEHKLNLEASKVEFMPKGYWFQGYWYDEDDD